MLSPPDLPFDNVHKFVATIGFFLFISALFLDPVVLTSAKILFFGAFGAGIGLIAWAVESAAVMYGRVLEEKDVLSFKEKRREKTLVRLLLGLRIGVPVAFVAFVALVLAS